MPWHSRSLRAQLLRVNQIPQKQRQLRHVGDDHQAADDVRDAGGECVTGCPANTRNRAPIPWRIAGTPAMTKALTNEKLRSLGFHSVYERYLSFASV